MANSTVLRNAGVRPSHFTAICAAARSKCCALCTTAQQRASRSITVKTAYAFGNLRTDSFHCATARWPLAVNEPISFPVSLSANGDASKDESPFLLVTVGFLV